MDVWVLIGRVLFSVLFLSSALGHFAQTEKMAAYAKSKGVPMPETVVPASGAVLGLGGLSILLGIWPDLGSILLAIMLLPTAVVMHPFWKESDAEARQAELTHFNKDLALAGAGLMLFGLFAQSEGLGLTLTGPLFRL